MSKSARKRSHDTRMKQRRALKAQKAALYKSYAGTGRKNKKRVHSGATRLKGMHASACGNIGCAVCFPKFAIVPQNKPQPATEGRDDLIRVGSLV